MNVTELQRQLADSEHLLPSQREFFSRLFFQLAFNNFSKFAIVGDTGSGKSTLALALAEFLSNNDSRHARVAFLSLSASSESIVTTLSKQWFSEPLLSENTLISQLTEAASATDFTLIIDNTENLTATDYQWLLALPVRVFFFSQYSHHAELNTGTAAVELTLTLPNITLADSEYLLRHEQLDALSVAKRYADSDSNLHKLLKKNIATTDDSVSAPARNWLRPAAIVFAMLLITAVSGYWFNRTTTTEPVAEAVRLPVTKPSVVTENVDALSGLTPLAVTTSAELAEEEPLLLIPGEALADVESHPQATDLLLMPEHAEPSTDKPVLTEPELPATEISTEQTEQSTEPSTAVSLADKVQSVSANTSTAPQIDADTAKLLELPAKQLLVQLTALSSKVAVQRFSRNHPTLTIHSYPRHNKDKVLWVVIAGPFEQQNAAKDYIAQLPADLRKAGPFIRVVGTVQQEIKDAAQAQRIRE